MYKSLLKSNTLGRLRNSLELFLIHRHQLYSPKYHTSFDISKNAFDDLYEHIIIGDIMFGDTLHCTKFKIIGRNIYNWNFIAMCINHNEHNKNKDEKSPAITFSVYKGLESYDPNYKNILQIRYEEYHIIKEMMKYRLDYILPRDLVYLFLLYV